MINTFCCYQGKDLNTPNDSSLPTVVTNMVEYESEEWYSIYEGESVTIEEAKLSYAERSNLPASAFCGPDRSFPANDAAHVRNGLARLKHSKFSPAIRARILTCLRRRAKKYDIEVSESEGIAVPEDRDEVIKWYLHEQGME